MFEICNPYCANSTFGLSWVGDTVVVSADANGVAHVNHVELAQVLVTKCGWTWGTMPAGWSLVGGGIAVQEFSPEPKPEPEPEPKPEPKPEPAAPTIVGHKKAKKAN